MTYQPQYQSGAHSWYLPAGESAGQDARNRLADAQALSRFSHLSTRDSLLVSTLTLFRQASASQLTRLHFADGSPASQGVRQRRACRRLVKWGAIGALPRPIGGGYGGSSQTIFIPAGSKTRQADMHTLNITELYVSLVESQAQLLAFDTEPYCHVQVGQIELKPDAFVDVRVGNKRTQYHIEVDLSSEFRPQLKAKMSAYNRAAHYWQEGNPPLVMFIVPDDVRKRFVESVVKKMNFPEQFRVVTFAQSIAEITS